MNNLRAMLYNQTIRSNWSNKIKRNKFQSPYSMAFLIRTCNKVLGGSDQKSYWENSPSKQMSHKTPEWAKRGLTKINQEGKNNGQCS